MDKAQHIVSLLVWDSNKIIGRLKITDIDLVEPGSSAIECELDGNGESSRSKLHVVKSDSIHSESTSKTITNILRSYFFENVHADVYASSSFTVSTLSEKNVNVHLDSECHFIKVLSADTAEAFIARCSSLFNVDNKQIIWLFTWSNSLQKFTLGVKSLNSILYNCVEENDDIFLAYGKGKEVKVKNVGVGINLRSGDEKYMQMQFLESEFVESFKSRIMFLPFNFDKTIPFDFNGCKLRNVGTMEDYNISLNSYLSLGGAIERLLCLELNVNLSRPSSQSGVGVPSRNSWECYKLGFNILGKCSSASCFSAKSVVCVNLGFPKLEVITDSKNVYNCPACFGNPIEIITFLVSGARAKFRFTKTLQTDTEVCTIESPSEKYEEYTVLKEEDVNNTQKIEYDFIEVTVVKYGRSFNHCQLCKNETTLAQEIVFPCGRAFCKTCVNLDEKCPVCSIPEYNIQNLTEIVESMPNLTVKLEVPNQVYGNCGDQKTTSTNATKPIGVFMKAFARTQLQASSDNKTDSLVEFQQNFVIENLPALIKNTTVNTLVIAKLRQLSILSEYDECSLVATSNEIEKARKLYKLVGTRVSGISSLLLALEEASQSGAAAILSGFFKYKEGQPCK